MTFSQDDPAFQTYLPLPISHKPLIILENAVKTPNNVGMFVATIPNRNSKPAILLRESYREGGKVKTRTISNLTKWPPERIAAMERLCKGEFDGWAGGEVTSGEIFGVLFALKHLADQVGITRVLGASAEGRLALFLTLARIAHGTGLFSSVAQAKMPKRPPVALPKAPPPPNPDEEDPRLIT